MTEITTLTPQAISKNHVVNVEELGISEIKKLRVDIDAANTAERILQEREDEIGFRRSNFWKSCCGAVMDRRAVQFFVQLGVGSVVITFCMVKICVAPEGENTTVYFSLLSALVGYFIPSPTLAGSH